MAEVWSLVPVPSSEQSHLLAQGYVQSGSEYFQARRLWAISEQPVPVFDFAHRKKNCFFMFKWIFLYFNLCPCLLSTGITKNLTSSSYFPLSGIYPGWKDPTKSPFFPGWAVLALSGSLCMTRRSIPLITFAGLQTSLKVWKNISRPWQLFLSLWWNSNFHCQCNCRGGVHMHVNWLMQCFFPPLALSHY